MAKNIGERQQYQRRRRVIGGNNRRRIISSARRRASYQPLIISVKAGGIEGGINTNGGWRKRAWRRSACAGIIIVK